VVPDGRLIVQPTTAAPIVRVAFVDGDTSTVDADISLRQHATYDDIPMATPSVTMRAAPGRTTRTSFFDLNNNLVQVHFRGAGTLTISLAYSSKPDSPTLPSPHVVYLKGHASLVIRDADGSSHLKISSMGQLAAVSQASHSFDNNPHGVADIASIRIEPSSTTGLGEFGSLNAPGTYFWSNSAWVGLDARGVTFTGPIRIYNIEAHETAIPVLRVGRADDLRILGGTLAQPNGREIQMEGVNRLELAASADSLIGTHAAQVPGDYLEGQEQVLGDLTAFDPLPKIQWMNVPPSVPVVEPTRTPIQLTDLIGTYRHTPRNLAWLNDAHVGALSFRSGSTSQLQWVNNMGQVFILEPDLENDLLRGVDENNPDYNDVGNIGLDIARNFRLEFQDGNLVGFRHVWDLFIRDGVPYKAIEFIPSAFFGHLAFYPETISPDHGYGQSHYVAIWPMLERPLDRLQVGLPGTWMVPDNRGYTHALLPPDNAIRIIAPDGAPAWENLFQTIEGSPAYLGSTQFFSIGPSATMPKYLMGANPEGYENAPGTPGFGWARGDLGPNGVSV
jgi:hypothetical protein